MAKKVTIYDLAKELNISPATVSRGLNNHPAISDITKKRIAAIANKLDYRSNKFAANLSNQKTYSLGVIVPRLDSYFMSTVLAGIEEVSNKAGYSIIISQSLESMDKEILNAKTLFNSGVDGLLVSLARDTQNYKHFTPYIKANIPLIFLDRVHNLTNCPTIVIDNVQAGYEATDHLAKQGCKNILIITGSLKRNVYADRLLGYKKALENNNLNFEEVNVFETTMESQNAKDVVDYIIKMNKPIDGLFVLSDSFAAYCIQELKRKNYLIPENIKVVGFNNDPISKLITPSLSTIEYPGYNMGLLAGESVINQIKGNIQLRETHSISLRHKLIIRESSGN
ncbi:LacI family DNA-binding transcriptional regulator [Flavivirga rizhaonensis]|uniref:LacI family transcriptional regulator n=1 Tax=Flavivirga rizhaonensis TaxID=2559571 RepID=A0A4S1E2U4_9FLAO|nr:LacI family DNA-binding transcriptional regulator [Flavivirga rizhaonensis]TGV04735.1 LacI family transcriptional regulator [Flavivirga rizhaonensis]